MLFHTLFIFLLCCNILFILNGGFSNGSGIQNTKTSENLFGKIIIKFYKQQRYNKKIKFCQSHVLGFQVVRNAESCANTIAMTLAPPMVIRVLAPLIQTGEYPLNLAAIKMLTKLIDCCGRDPVFKYLPDLMPGLIQVTVDEASNSPQYVRYAVISLDLMYIQ